MDHGDLPKSSSRFRSRLGLGPGPPQLDINMEPEDDGFLGRSPGFFQVTFWLVNTGVCVFFVGFDRLKWGKM